MSQLSLPLVLSDRVPVVVAAAVVSIVVLLLLLMVTSDIVLFADPRCSWSDANGICLLNTNVSQLSVGQYVVIAIVIISLRSCTWREGRHGGKEASLTLIEDC